MRGEAPRNSLIVLYLVKWLAIDVIPQAALRPNLANAAVVAQALFNVLGYTDNILSKVSLLSLLLS